MRWSVLILFCSLLTGVKAQQLYTDFVTVRNYRFSVQLLISNEANHSFLFDDFGNNRVSRRMHTFSFQSFGQEYSSNLDLYFFPNRSYQLRKLKFQQPDPKSQYFSGYNFLAADPINCTDKDGNEDKPLVLYEESHFFEEGTDWGVADLGNHIGVNDAYYVPLSDFFNGKLGDIPEWNGNVFIYNHTSKDFAHEMQIESSPEKKYMRTDLKKQELLSDMNETEYFIRADARELGGYLGKMCSQRGLHVNNIFMGGCIGAEPAKRIGQGYIEAMPKHMNRTLWVHGLKKNRYAMIVGKIHSSYPDNIGIEDTRYYVSRNRTKFHPYYKQAQEEGEKRKFLSYSYTRKDGLREELPYAKGDEVTQMVREAKVPKSIQKYFDSFPIEY